MDPSARRNGASTTLTEAEGAALKVLQRLHAATRRFSVFGHGVKQGQKQDVKKGL